MRNAPLDKKLKLNRKIIVFKNKLAILSISPCWMRKMVEKSSAILALLDDSLELHLDR